MMNTLVQVHKTRLYLTFRNIKISRIYLAKCIVGRWNNLNEEQQLDTNNIPLTLKML